MARDTSELPMPLALLGILSLPDLAIERWGKIDLSKKNVSFS
jgi:hypothetical protein